MAIATLVEAFGVKDISPVRIKVYEKALSKVPANLLPAMVERTVETRKVYGKDALPAVADLLADAEACRKALSAANPYDGCADCEDQRGWRMTERADGTKCVERCPCLIRHQQKLAQLGCGGGPLALPPAESSELTRIGEVE